MLVSLTVGKVDAGVAVLLTDDKRLIEFPSILLPPGISCGSIVDINVARNYKSEAAAASSFARLQTEIYDTFGRDAPTAPVLRCRNATQTSVVLEWDPLHLATANLRSLSLYRNGAKAGTIPRPLNFQSTKISGLAIDTEYVFQLVLRTSAGTFSSDRITVRTHKMTDLSGITITPGIMPAALRESLLGTVERIGAKVADSVRIDTTQFVCTEGRGQSWEKAVDMNIPVVVPDWLKGCEREGRVVGVRGYYLNADPRMRQVGPAVVEQSQQPQQPQQQSKAQRDISTTASGSDASNDQTTSTKSQPQPSQREAEASQPPTPPPKLANQDQDQDQDQVYRQQHERTVSDTRNLTSPHTIPGTINTNQTAAAFRPKDSRSTDRDDHAEPSPYVSAKADHSGDDDDDDDDDDDAQRSETETDGDGSYSSAADISGTGVRVDATGAASRSAFAGGAGGAGDVNDGSADGDGQDGQRFDEVAL